MNLAAAIPNLDWRRIAVRAGLGVAFTLFIAVAVFGSLIFPPAAVLFFAPVMAAIAIKAPSLRAAPKQIVMPLLYAGVFLLPLWPVYLNLKLGPAPILTPPRLILYAVTAFWIYDMTVSALRRGQLRQALTRGWLIAAPIGFLWALSLVSTPLAEGKSVAAAEFFRQTTVWWIPFLVAATYVRRAREFRRCVVLAAIAAGALGAIALCEVATGKLLANLLSPFIRDDQTWLQAAQALKIRDGVFRAQATHTHPLSLGQFLAMLAPVALALCVSARSNSRRVLWAICLLLVVGGALAANSRGAFLGLAVSLFAAAAIFAFRFLKRASSWRFRPAAGLVMAIALVLSPVMAVGAGAMIAGKGGESAARSSQSRADQIEQAIPKIMKRPLTGYGPGRAARVLGYWGTTLTVDNYYLTTALDLGVLGPLGVLAGIGGMGALSLRRSTRPPRSLAAIHVGLFGAAAALAMMLAITSQTGNFGFLFVLLGAMAGASSSARPGRTLSDGSL